LSLRSSAQLRPCRDLDLDPRHSQQICLSNTGIEHLLKSFKLFWGYYSNKHLHVPLVCPYMPSSHCTLYYTLNFVIFQSTHETPGPKFCSHVPWKAVATSMLTAQPNKKNSHHPPSKPHLRAQTPSTCTNPTYVHKPTYMHKPHLRAQTPPTCTNPTYMHKPHLHAQTPPTCTNPIYMHKPHLRAQTPPTCTNPTYMHKPHLRAQTPSTCTNPTYVHSSNLRSVVLTEIRGCKFFTSDLVATSTRRSSKQDGYQSPSIP